MLLALYVYLSDTIFLVNLFRSLYFITIITKVKGGKHGLVKDRKAHLMSGLLFVKG